MLLPVIFDIDGVLLDVRPSFYAIISDISGATYAEIRAFKDAGGFNDDWELARAAIAWIAAGRPLPIRAGGWRAVVARCGHDPGDVSEMCRSMYHGGKWREEKPLLETSKLARLASATSVYACTGRDAAELALAETRLGFHFERATTCEHVRKPDPLALLRLAPHGHYFGDTEDDRACAAAAGFIYHHVTTDPVAMVDTLLEEAGA